jgi:putative ABC transport system permease protein
MIGASLMRRHGSAWLAVLAVAIGASVAAALLHVSADVEHKLTRELRALGPNLLIVPAASARGSAEYLDAGEIRRRLDESQVNGALLLYVSTHAQIDGRTIEVPVIGAEMELVRALHPSWHIGAGDARTLIGARLRAVLGDAATRGVRLENHGRTLELGEAATLDAGGPDDDAWWIPLADAQRLAGQPGTASLAEARVADAGAAESARAALEREGGVRVLVLHALSETEAGLLARTRRLMALVTAAALVSAGLCAFGTLTDLALERRRDIALLKSLGASRSDIVRLFAAESLLIGALGGLGGWLLGTAFAEFIGRTVFHSTIALRPEVPFFVLALSIAVAAVASLGPIRLALSIEPAAALKGD